MSSKRFRSTYFLFGVFFVLLLLVIFYFNDSASQKRITSRFDRPLLKSSQISGITKIIFDSVESDPIELRSDAGKWMIGDYSVDPDISSNLLTSLKDLPYGKVVSQNSNNWDRYDVSDDKASVIRLFHGDEASSVYYIGKPDTASSFHMRRNSDERVFLVNSDMRSYVLYDVDRWRDKRLFPYDSKDIRQLSVRTGDEKWSFVYEDEKWKQVKDIGSIPVPDSSSFERYLESFWNIKANLFVDDESLFESSDNAVFVVFDDGMEYTVSVDAKDDDMNYAQVTGKPGLLRIPTDLSKEIRPVFLEPSSDEKTE